MNSLCSFTSYKMGPPPIPPVFNDYTRYYQFDISLNNTIVNTVTGIYDMTLYNKKLSQITKKFGLSSLRSYARNNTNLSAIYRSFPTTGLTFGVWVYITIPGPIFGYSNADVTKMLSLRIMNNTRIVSCFVTNTAGSYVLLNSNVSIPLSTWTHIVWTIGTNGVWSLYINGFLNIQETKVYPYPDTNQYIDMATEPGDGTFDGFIDSFVYYTRALTSNDVYGLYTDSY